MSLYKYLYYRLYSWNLKTWGESNLPHWNALFGVSFMMFLNLSTMILSLGFFGINFWFVDPVPKKEIVTIMVVIGAINFFQFIYNEKY